MTETSLLDLIFIFGQDKWTPLMIASRNAHVDIVNVLLQHGASVHLHDKVKLHMLYTILVHNPPQV